MIAAGRAGLVSGAMWGIMFSFIGIANTNTTNLAVVAPGQGAQPLRGRVLVLLLGEGRAV